MYKVGWFSTANGKTSQLLLAAVMDQILSGQLQVQIPFVFTSREAGEGIESDNFINMVKGYNLPLITFSFEAFRRQHAECKRSQVRHLYDQEVLKLLQDYTCDIAILAGYMLIVSDEMCQAYKMINLHPSLPDGPKGTWREVIWQLIDNKDDRSGAMMHLVTPDLDRGPVMTYCSFDIRGKGFDEFWQQTKGRTVQEIQIDEGEQNALFQKIRSEGVRREFPLIIYTLRAFSSEQIHIQDHHLYNKEKEALNGLNITDVVEQEILKTTNS